MSATCKCGAPSLPRAVCADLVLKTIERSKAGEDVVLRLISLSALVLGHCMDCAFPTAGKEAV